MEDKFLIVYERLKVLRLDQNVLCKEFWLKVQDLKNNFDEKVCWEMVTHNIEWLLNGRKHFNLDFDILSSEELTEWFNEEELNTIGIYSKGKHKVKNGKFVGIGNCELEVSGHTEVVLFDNAFADCYDTTFCKAHDNSTFKVNDCIAHAFGNSKGRAVGTSIIENWTSNIMEKGRFGLVVNR